MTETFEKVSPSDRIILFLSMNCDACRRLENELPEIEGVEFTKYWVMPSRLNNKFNIRPQLDSVEGMPLVVDKSQLPILPAALDTKTQELSYGFDGIMQYLESCGLI